MKHTLMISLALLAFAPLAAAERKAAEPGDARKAPEALSADAIVQRHLAALGGEKLLRDGKTFTFTVTGEKLGKKTTRVVTQARPNLMRIDITSDDGPVSKGYDGKVAWMKKDSAAAAPLTGTEAAMMAERADFDEPLLDYAKKGMKVKLAGATAEAYDLEVTLKSGDVEHHILDASSFLVVRKTWMGKDKDGKPQANTIRFSDYRAVQGRQVNHAYEWELEGKASR
ncbi:MAG: hypothetical protein KIT31_06350, partial [Deltaproteobacteria bacterium]|nr:hypothetical protein [Deltaproteobacteria bacterium]